MLTTSRLFDIELAARTDLRRPSNQLLRLRDTFHFDSLLNIRFNFLACLPRMFIPRHAVGKALFEAARPA